MLNTKLIAHSFLLLIFSSALFAEERLICGWIDDFDGPQDAYTLIRDEMEYKISVYMPLYANDQITVNDDHALRIGRPDGSSIIVNKGDKTLTLIPIEKETHVLDNLIKWVGEWFGSNVIASQEEQVVSLVIRGSNYDPLTMPLSPLGISRLVSGDRFFYLSWEGGSPPFQVELVSGNNDQVFVAKGLDSWSISALPVRLTEGQYRLIVRDPTQELETELVVVNTVKQPSGPKELDSVILPDDVESTLRAIWIAGIDNGEWVLEAYQKVSPLARSYRPAMLLRDQLQRGNYPSR